MPPKPSYTLHHDKIIKHLIKNCQLDFYIYASLTKTPIQLPVLYICINKNITTIEILE